jgi:O-antigen/teichoic acid export membrane protein/aminoglycoside phosphotransferase
MTTLPPPEVGTAPIQPVVVDDRMNRNATALVAGSVLTSVLGFAFWVIAARTMSKADVGVGGAAVAALVLLGNISTLGLRNALPRFLPLAGASSRRLIIRSYAAAGAAGVACAGVFVVGARLWAPDLAALHDGIAGRVLFMGAVAVWAVFILQDSVLIGLRHATWVPIENLGYAVGKLVLLVVLASTGSWALLVAWVIPALLIIGPLNHGIFRRLIPATSSPAPAGEDAIHWRSIVRFASGDHLADTIRFFGAEGVVLIVVAHVGAELSAPLFFAITIAATLGLVSSNIVSAFVAEASARPYEMEALLRRSARRAASLVVPAALVAAAAAPIGLSIFGSDYSTEGTTVLRLLLLAAIPQIVSSLAIGVARFHRRVVDVVKIAIASSLAPLVGAAFLVPHFGIVAIGWSFLIGQTLLALELLRRWSAGRRAWSSRGLQMLVGLRSRVRQQRRHRAAATLFDELDATRDGGEALHPRRFVPTETDVVVAIVERPTDPVVVKIALSDAATRGLFAHERALAALRRATEGMTCANLLPRRVENGVTVGQSYLIETACAGEPAETADSTTVHAVAHAMLDIHRATLRPVSTDDDLVHRLVTEPMRVLRSDPRLADRNDSLERVQAMLTRALLGRQLHVARTHGDYWLGNVLLDRSAEPPRVTGIIDWENSLDVGLPEVDLAHLWLSMQRSGTAGGVLMAVMQGRFADVIEVADNDLPNPDLAAGLVVTLAWLAHVSDGLQRSTHFSLGRVWLRRNVGDVLDVLDAVADDQLDRRSVLD